MSQVANLSFSMNSLFGEISVTWKRTTEGNDCELTVIVPYDTECKLILDNKEYCLRGGLHTFLTKYLDA